MRARIRNYKTRSHPDEAEMIINKLKQSLIRGLAVLALVLSEGAYSDQGISAFCSATKVPDLDREDILEIAKKIGEPTSFSNIQRLWRIHLSAKLVLLQEMDERAIDNFLGGNSRVPVTSDGVNYFSECKSAYLKSIGTSEANSNVASNVKAVEGSAQISLNSKSSDSQSLLKLGGENQDTERSRVNALSKTKVDEKLKTKAAEDEVSEKIDKKYYEDLKRDMALQMRNELLAEQGDGRDESFYLGSRDAPEKKPVSSSIRIIKRSQPRYPRKALSRGISGWVEVEFTVTKKGKVRDAKVVGNCAFERPAGKNVGCSDSPNPIFDKSALRAVSKFKYEAPRVNGQSTDVLGVRTKFHFHLD